MLKYKYINSKKCNALFGFSTSVSPYDIIPSKGVVFMPWKETNVMNEKTQFIDAMLKAEKPFKHICADFTAHSVPTITIHYHLSTINFFGCFLSVALCTHTACDFGIKKFFTVNGIKLW